MGKTAAAETLLDQTLEGYRATVGEDHDYAWFTKAMLAETYQAEGRLAEAELLFKQPSRAGGADRGDAFTALLFVMNPLG